MKRIQLEQNAYLNILPAEKFNRCRITVQLRYEASREKATACALLPFLMERGYADCPDPTALSCRLAQLYGATLSADATASGACRSLTVSVDGIQQRFALHEECLAEEYARLALGTVFRPAFKEGMFDAGEIEIEKKKLAEELAGEINDKRLYCLRQARRKFFGNHPAGIERIGYLDEVEGLTAQKVTEAWHWMVENSHVEVFCSGLDEEQAAELVRKELQAVKRNPAPLPEMDAMPVQEPCEYLETMDMVQAKLCLLFTVADFDPVTELSAMRVAMAVLGGSPTSRLFVNVREKQSLCYYCSASFNSYGGMMCIDSGIEPENAKTAQQAILNEWNWLKENLPTEQEMEDARRFILNSLAAVGDSISAQENWYIGQLWRNSTESPQEVHQQLLEVTPQQVQEMMKKFHFSVAYLLTKEELADENNH